MHNKNQFQIFTWIDFRLIKKKKFSSVFSLISEYSQGYLLPEFTKIKNQLPNDIPRFSEEILNAALSELRKKCY